MRDRRGSREGGRDEGTEADTRALHNAQIQAWLYTEACQWLLAFTLHLHVGGRD